MIWVLFNLLLTTLCIAFSALASGLTLALVTLDVTELDETLDSRHEKIRELLSDRHLLLVTLLLLNTIVNESIPLFLDDLMPTSIAALTATALVLFFGEILPSAVFIGSQKLLILSFLAPLVRCFIIVLFPVSYPISKMLDCLLLDNDNKHTKISQSENIFNEI